MCLGKHCYSVDCGPKGDFGGVMIADVSLKWYHGITKLARLGESCLPVLVLRKVS